MPRMLSSFLIIATATYIGFCAYLFVVQDALIYYPQPRAISSPESTMVLPVEGAELIISARPRPGPNAIIYFGGNAEDVSYNLPPFEKSFPDYAIYLLHYRGYGGSSGSPTEKANHQDALSLFDKVRANHSNIIIVGRSLGAGVAVRLASQRKTSRLILITPYDSLLDVAAGQFPWIPVKLLLRDKYDSGRYAPQITAPTAIIAAENDEIIPRASTEKLFARFGKGVASIIVIPAASHNTISSLDALQSAL